MNAKGKTRQELVLENEQLQARLAEAEEALEAIRGGEVDALFISGAAGDQVYTLEGADSAYRALVENMQEGALTLLEDGSILYCNQRLAEIVGQPLENVLGTSFDRFIDPSSEADYRALRERCRHEKSSGEVQLRVNSAHVPAYLSLNNLMLKDLQCISMVVTDLSEQKRNEQIAADERLARAILEQAAECIVVCDARGVVIRASQEARGFATVNPLSQPFEQAFPLRLSSGNDRGEHGRFSCAPILQGEKVENLEAGLIAGDSVMHHLLVSAGPLHGAQGKILGCVISMTDITARKRADQERERLLAERQRQNEFLDKLINNASIGVAVVDRDFRYILANPAYRAIPSSTGNPLTGSTIAEVFSAQVAEIVHSCVQEVFQRGEPLQFPDYEVNLGPGRERTWWDVNEIPLRDGNGEVEAVLILTQDVTNRKQAESRLLEVNRELAENDKRKNEFLAMLAHELRNPLAPVRNAVEILKMVGPKDPVLQKNRDMIERQVTHMARLLDDLLEVSPVTRGKIRLQKERLDLRVVVMQAVEVALHSLGNRLKLHYQNPDEPLWLDGDYTRLEQVVGNLIGNAMKYTDEGEIHVSLECRSNGTGGTWALLRVQDTGVGIAPEMLPRVFEMFAQADQSLERTRGGLGIGLTMVQRLVQMHGGRVEARSEGPGRGSEFRVWLPLAAQPADEGESQDQPARGGTAGGGRGPLKALVVDDNMDAAQSLSDILELWGCQAQPAYDGPTALRRALEDRPDVILLDIGLPGMSGYEVARKLRDEPAMEAVKIIALTGYGQEEARQRSRECGFDGHLVKPVDLHELQALMERISVQAS